MFYIISQQFNSSLCLGLTLTVPNLAWRRKLLCWVFLCWLVVFFFLNQHRQDCLKPPRRCRILEAVLLSTHGQVRTKMLWNSAVRESDHGAHRVYECIECIVPQAQRGGLGAEEIPSLPSHQLLQGAGPAPDLTSASDKYVETWQRTASKIWVWEPKPPELPWCCGTGLLLSRHSVPSAFQILHLPRQLEGTTQLKLPAFYQGLLLSLAAFTDVVSTPLILFFWQPLPMTSLKENPLKNCLLHSLLPLSALSASNIS